MSTDTATAGTDALALVKLLDRVETMPAATALRARSYELLAPPPGALALVVDVGCGSGRAVAELREQGVTAIGLDPSEQMIDLASERWPDCEFRVGNADALPFGDAQVAGYRADKVFHELEDPARALDEARRVLVPGGHIVLLGQDFDTFVIDSDDPELTRAIVRARADTIPSPRAARRYRNLLLDAGFTDVTVEIYTGMFTETTMLPMLTGIVEAAQAAGAITHDQAESWTAEQTARADDDRLFLALPLFLAAGRQP